MNRLHSISASLVAAVFSVGIAASAVVPASAQSMAPNMPGMRNQCGSAHNLAKVHRRLDGAIDHLSHDQHDYGGHRVTAMNDLQAARTEIVAAESYAESNYHVASACFTTAVRPEGSDANWGTRNQGESNESLLNVRRWVERMIDELQHDQRDYGGHRVNAINDMQQARNELIQGEKYR